MTLFQAATKSRTNFSTELRGKLETAEQAKASAARKVTKLEKKTGTKARRTKAATGKSKKVASESKPTAPMGGTAKNSGWNAPQAKALGVSSSGQAKTRKKKDMEVWEYASPVWQDSGGMP